MHESEVDVDGEDDDDPDYQPSFDITAIFCSSMTSPDGVFSSNLQSNENIAIFSSYFAIGIMELSCKKPTRIVESFVGSAMYLKWMCDENHVSHQWCSQPHLNRRLHSGDFLICGSILTSGNNYGKMALWAEMLSLKFPSADQFHRISSSYIIPSIDNFWNNHKRDLLPDFQDRDVVVLWDGRNDSPGHSAQYCSYTLMDNDTKKILTIHTLDRKSPNMEKAGFQAAMDELLEENINIKEVVTDAHLGISSVMKKQYPDIHHSHDIWLAAKNLGKKILKLSDHALKVAQKKGNNILLGWCKDIANHFWFSCRAANTYEEFVGIWRSVLHHITNAHEWIIPNGGVNHCLHGNLSEEERNKVWLSPTEHAHVLKDLATVLLDKRLLNNVGYLLNFRSTADLEGFHQHLLMYCSKRFAFTPPVYRARNRLAALDHNMNVNRPVERNKDGKIRYHRVFNKKSGRWTVHALKTRKQYNYNHLLLASALILRIHDRVGMKLTTLAPRNISKHLAPLEPPPQMS